MSIKSVHEGLTTPLDMVESITGTRSEVESASQLLGAGDMHEGLVKERLDLVVLVVAKNALNQRQDLGQLVDLIEGGDVLYLFRADGGVDGNSFGDLHDVSANLPADGAGGPNRPDDPVH